MPNLTLKICKLLSYFHKIIKVFLQDVMQTGRDLHMSLMGGLVKYGRLVATGDYDFNFLDSIHFLNS